MAGQKPTVVASMPGRAGRDGFATGTTLQTTVPVRSSAVDMTAADGPCHDGASVIRAWSRGMSRAWRVVAALTVSLGVAYVATSWLAGRVVERVYRDQLDQVIALLVEQGSVVERHYRRGIFRSEGSIVLKMPLVPGERTLKSWFRVLKTSAADRDATVPKDACAGIRCLSVHLAQTVEHGPLVDGRPMAARVRLSVTRLEGAPGPSRHLAERLQTRQLIISHGWTGRFEAKVLPLGEVQSGSDHD